VVLTSVTMGFACGKADWSAVQWVGATLLAFDLFGGVAVNASSAARSYFFRAGRTTRHHLVFVVLHVVHVAAFSWLFREGDPVFTAVVGTGLLVSALGILVTPVHARRPVAMLFMTLGTVLSLAAEDPVSGMEWFIPVLLTKLLVCYLLGDVPAAPEPAPARPLRLAGPTASHRQVRHP